MRRRRDSGPLRPFELILPKSIEQPITTKSIQKFFGKCLVWPWPLNPWSSKSNQFAVRLQEIFVEDLVTIPSFQFSQSINQFIRHNQTHKYKIIMTTYRKLLYGVTGSTQGADAPLVRATHVMKTNSTHIIVQNIKTPSSKAIEFIRFLSVTFYDFDQWPFKCRTSDWGKCELALVGIKYSID